MVDLTSKPRFRFIGMSVMGLGISRAIDLAIGGAVSMRADVAVGFSRLFLW